MMGKSFLSALGQSRMLGNLHSRTLHSQVKLQGHQQRACLAPLQSKLLRRRSQLLCASSSASLQKSEIDQGKHKPTRSCMDTPLLPLHSYIRDALQLAQFLTVCFCIGSQSSLHCPTFTHTLANTLEESSGPLQTLILDVESMKCGGCSASVKRILMAKPEVHSAAVNLLTECAVVQYNNESRNGVTEEIMEALTSKVLYVASPKLAQRISTDNCIRTVSKNTLQIPKVPESRVFSYT